MSKLPELDFRYIFLIGLLLFLPGLEALKNLCALFFVLSWLYVAWNNKYWGGKWRVIDSIFLLWILSAIIVSVNAIVTHQLPGDNFRDILRFVLIAWVLSRTNFSKEKLVESAFISIIAVTCTLAYGYIAGNGELKELYSVGHINHTAIFLLISYSISISLLLFNFENLKKIQKFILVLTTVILFISIVDTNSRAAFGLLILITIIDFVYFLKAQSYSFKIIFMIMFPFLGILLIFNPPEALQRIQAQETILDDDNRTKIRAFSYYAFKTNPYLGVGFGNFSKIEMDDIAPLIIKDKGFFDGGVYLKSAHAHNVYYTYLTSGGILIFSIFIWFWFYIVWIITKINKSAENEWIVISSISVVMINLLIGIVNTTLHHEHAIMSMFVLGLLVSKYRMSQLRNELIM